MEPHLMNASVLSPWRSRSSSQLRKTKSKGSSPAPVPCRVQPNMTEKFTQILSDFDIGQNDWTSFEY